ncbi:haloacid dehalogenase-like hydrolase family protein [Histomonas meleagridis]|uniref:haloacid dehalogenase-like hydrolase family protein n=1 Tax=Histomonas meleagridis TaxID=135588 RepID=UPI003559BEBE|nr:haloacid dehalogenase-like hydrolase family protein [Histomonas meleagridis]KAH0799989.1 haloacid dehalogenase-like hydrolase family protein [Histomonas meleagridis]
MGESVAWPNQIKAVIFDNDGVILDTLPLYYEALARIVPPPFEQSLIDRVNGRSDMEASKIFIEHFHLDMTPEELCEKRFKILQELFPTSKLVPGVDKIIRAIHEKHIPLAVATSSERSLHETKTSNYKDLYSLFDVTICGNDVTAAKPSPEIFQVASKRLGNYQPENVLVFEDSFHGIKAANTAGMATCFIHPPFEDAEREFKEKGINPSYQISSFNEFDFNKFIW